MALVAGGWLWIRNRPDPTPSQPGSAAGAAEEPVDGASGTAAARVEAERTAQELEHPPDAESGLRIRFRARAEDGSWDSAGDGRATAYWNRTHKWGRGHLDITGGVAVLHPQLSREAPREWLELDHVRLDGRRAVATGGPWRYPSGGELTVDCEYLPASILVVYEGPERAHGRGLQLAVADGFPGWDLAVPIYRAPAGPTGQIGADLSSPIVLDDRDGTIVYFVRSERSAWSRVAIDHETPGTRTVALRPGGRVELTVIARTLSPHTRLRIFGSVPSGVDSTPSALCFLDEEGRGFVDGLREGSWEVRAEVGSANWDNPVLASRQFTVVADRTTLVELVLADPPALPAPVHVHGEVFLPEPVLATYIASGHFILQLDAEDPWAPEYGHARFVPLTEGRRDARDANRLLWDAGRLTPGPWKAQLRCVQWCEAWTIEPERENVLTIDLGELRTTRLQLVDRRTAAPVPIEELLYLRTSGPGCKPGNAFLRPARGEAADVLSLQAIEGAYWFEIEEKDSGRRMSLEVATLGPPGGLQVVEFSSTPSATVSLALNSGETSVPMPGSWWRRVEFRRADGQPAAPTRFAFGGTGISSDATNAQFTFALEGLVEIRFPPAEDFLDLAPATIDLVADETSSLTVELRPAY